MRARRFVTALAFFLLGTGCVCAFGPLFRYAQDQFMGAEPLFASPLRAPGGVLNIRRDINGKGHFGASRNGGRTHQGVDLLSSVSDPVFASKSGRVAYAGWQKGYGGVVKIAHPGDALSVYAHLSYVMIREGDWVTRHSVIGRTGKSGNASERNTLPHVHYEIRIKDIPTNPAQGLLDKSIKIV